jgi:aspartate-semialdehyde dehydrogenase
LANRPRIGVVGATGAVGTITLELLRERGYENVRLFASARSAGTQLGGSIVEEATPEALAAGDLDLCLFSVGTSPAASSCRTPFEAVRSRSTSRLRTGSSPACRSSSRR